MLIDGRQVATDSTVEADLCIIGAGPAGITIARECLDSGLSMCLLESGGVRSDWAPRELSAGESVGYRYYNLARTRIRAFGGTSHYWIHDVGLRARPLDPLDFEQREEVPGSGWPISRDDLDPYYARAQRICRLGPYRYDAEFWAGRSPHAPLDALGDLDAPVFQFGPSDPFPNQLDLFRSSPDLDLYSHSTVTEIVPDARGERVERLRVVATEGDNRFSVAAGIYVLATGGIENPRLLLLSRSIRPEGLGNEHGMVGRCFMEHLALRTGYVRPPNADLFEEARFYRPHEVEGTRIQGMLSVPPETLRHEGLRNATFFLDPVSNPEAMEIMARLRLWLMTRPRGAFPLGTALRLLRDPASIGEYGVSALQHLRSLLGSGESGAVDRALDSLQSTVEREPSVFQLKVMAEQSPDPCSRVTLGRRADRFGNPLPRLEWKVPSEDARSIRRCQDIIDRTFRDAGWGPLEGKLPDDAESQRLFHGQWHHMGTTRMHEDPSRGVVDPEGRVHTVENLYVAGSSVFPTSGYANPTLTIVALAARLADHLRESYGEGATSARTRSETPLDA